MQNLTQLGWNTHFQNAWNTFQTPSSQDLYEPGRVLHVYGDQCEVQTEQQRLRVSCPQHDQTRPVTGDWVVVRHCQDTHLLHSILPRRTTLRRGAAGTQHRIQDLASNIDVIFLVTSANQQFNLGRIERFLVAIYDSGAQPVIILNKVDLCANLGPHLRALRSVSSGAPILSISALFSLGVEDLSPYLHTGQTVALFGSSGVGKSTLANALLTPSMDNVDDVGESAEITLQDTGAIRAADDQGKHTTTTRDLLILPDNRGLLIDTPGIRELRVAHSQEAVEATFQDLEMLAQQCRFRNCQHDTEPGCAIQEQIQHGELSFKRLQRWMKIQREQAFYARKEARRHRQIRR